MASRRAAAAAAAAGRALRRHGAGLGVSPLYRQLIRVEGSSNVSWQELLGTSSSVSPFSTASPFVLHSSGFKGSCSLLPHLVRHASGGPAASAQHISVRDPQEAPLPLPIAWQDSNNKDESKANKGSGSKPDGPKSYKVDFSSPEACDEAVDSLLAARNKALDGFKARYGERMWLGRIRQVAQLATNILLAIPRFLLQVPGWLKTLFSMSRSDWAQSWVKLKAGAKREAQHYWAGTKLLGWDIRIASELTFKVLRGKQLTRREKRQLTRTVADVFRLVPMVVILIVPFMELALPFLLRIFPNMLPSTYQDSMKAEENLRKKVVVKLEMAKFLQDTLEEMAKDIKQNRTGELSSTAAEFTAFMNKVRTGSAVSNNEIIKFSKLFNDELTLDNLSRPQLVSMCKYMGVPSIGSDAFLRYQLRAKLQWIKRDDRMIQNEGIDSLNAEELRAACRTRGMRWSGVDTEHMKKQLTDWLDLSLNRALPSSLLIMSRAFTIGNMRVTPDEAMHALQETLSSMPDEVLKDVGMEVLASKASSEQRLEYLRRQREKIELEEEEALKQEQADAAEGVKPLPELEATPAAQRAHEEELLSPQEKASREAVRKEEKIRDISRALAVLAASSSVAREREDFIELVEKEIEYYNRRQVEDGEHDTSSALLERVNGMLHKIEKELDNVDSRIGDKLHVLDRDKDGKITPDELAAAITTLRDSLHHDQLTDLIEQLDQDIDGKISIQNILELAEEEDEDEENVEDDKKENPELLKDDTEVLPAVESPSRQQAKA